MNAFDPLIDRFTGATKNLTKSAIAGLLVSQTMVIVVHFADIPLLFSLGALGALMLAAQLPFAMGRIIRFLMLTGAMTCSSYIAATGILASSFILLGFEFPFPLGSLAYLPFYAPEEFSGRLAVAFIPLLIATCALASAALSGALIWINIIAYWPSLNPGSFTDHVLNVTGSDLWRGLAKYFASNQQSAALATALGAGATFVAAQGIDEDGEFIVPINDWVTARQFQWIEERSYPDWDAYELTDSSRDEVYGVNPNTMLPMADELIDVGGNAYGTGDDWHSMDDMLSSSIDSDSLFD